MRCNDPAITDSLGWALFKGGRTAEAIALLERATESEPTIAEIGEHLGDAYWAAGRRIDARYAWRAALVQAEDGDAKRLSTKIEFGPGTKP
jgi:Flp pilus assembly protein TadD